MKNIECIGGPLDGDFCPLYDWHNSGDIFHLFGGDWPDTIKTGSRRRCVYVYGETERLIFRGYK